MTDDAPLLTPDEINRIRFEVLGLGHHTLADRLGLRGKHGDKTVIAWESGKTPISGPAALALRYMAQDWVRKDDRYPPADRWFEVWDDEHKCLIPYCHLRPESRNVSSTDRNWSGTWTYWRRATLPPPGLTMDKP